jgi:hypothetical protein
MTALRKPSRTHVVVLASLLIAAAPAWAQSSLQAVGDVFRLVAPGAAVPGGITVRALDAGGSPVAGATVTFTAPSAGASVRFTNGTASTPAVTDAGGYAHADGSANMVAGTAEVNASAGTATVVALAAAIEGPGSLQDSWPNLWTTGDMIDLDVRVQLPWISCAYAAAAAVALAGGNVGLTVNGVAVSEATYAPETSCVAGHPYEVVAGTVVTKLLPGDYDVNVLVQMPQGLPLQQMQRRVSVRPNAELAIPGGSGTLQVGLTLPAQPANETTCASVTARIGAAGSTGFAAAPPDVDMPYGVVRVDALQCAVSLAAADAVHALSYRGALGAPASLPDGTVVWAYGPTADNATAHWYALRTTLSGRFALFDVVDGGAGDNATTADLELHLALAIGTPRKPTVDGALNDLWWVGSAENGWGLSLTQHGPRIFAGLFVYDAQGKPTWVVMPAGSWDASGTVYTGALYRPHGLRYDEYSTDAFVVGPSVGTLRLTVSSMSAIAMDYTIDGVTGHKALQRQRFGPADPFFASSYGDLWWGGVSQNGWGFALAQQSSTMFGVWFVYDGDHNPTWFVAPAIRALSSTLYRTQSSAWLGATYDPSKLSVSNAGSATLTFGRDGSSLDVLVDGQHIVKPIERQAF